MTDSSTNRRDLIKSSIATAGVMALTGLAATTSVSTQEAYAAVGNKLLDSTSTCLKVGRVCETHCINELSKGNKGMAACLSAVRDMLAACEALLDLASAESKHTKAMAKLCSDTCSDCAKACEPHAQHMAICAQCRDACLECEKACKEVA